MPYGFASLRTNAAGRPVCSDSAVAIGTPPSSSPAITSVPGGTSGAAAAAIAASSTGSASKRYLSKYSVAVGPSAEELPRRWGGTGGGRARSMRASS